MSSKTRKYELKQRAERERQTHERIVRAAAELHGEVGPAATTVAEIARRAGVSRPTVYKHFPDEAELFPLCQAHFLSEHPLPDLSDAFALEDPLERVRAVLTRIYGWYREAGSMTANVQRDRGAVPALDELLSRTADAGLDLAASALADGFTVRGKRRARLRTLLRLALDFWSWRRLDAQGLDDVESAALIADATAALAPPLTRRVLR
jgi:AcrR family transcriptional regulator